MVPQTAGTAVTDWATLLFDKGLAPVATLTGVSLTLFFTNRSEARRLRAAKAELLRDRKIELYFTISKVMYQ